MRPRGEKSECGGFFAFLFKIKPRGEAVGDKVERRKARARQSFKIRARYDLTEDVRRMHQRERVCGLFCRKQTKDLASDTLRADGRKAFALAFCRRKCFFFNFKPEPRRKAESAQNAERILGEPSNGITDGADDADLEVIGTAERIAKTARGRIRHRVDGEIAPREVLGNIFREFDRVGTPPVGVVAVDAVGGDLEGHTLDDDGHGAVLFACQDRVEISEDRLDFIGRRRGGDVVVVQRTPEHSIAHRPADDVSLVAERFEFSQSEIDRTRQVHIKLYHTVTAFRGSYLASLE